MPTHEKEFEQELLRLGELKFQLVHPSCVLIMVGKASGGVGQAHGAESTIFFGRTEEEPEVAAMMGRVFVIIKDKYAPPGKISLGRTNKTDVMIAEHTISRSQCFFEPNADGGMTLTDAGSTNGTLVGGVKLTPQSRIKLNGDEVLTLGRFIFSFQKPSTFVAYLKMLKYARR